MWLMVLGCTAEKQSTSDPVVQDTSDHRSEIQEALIVGGTFTMGCTEGDDNCSVNESPPHTVEITRDYYMLTTEVTQELYEWVTGENPSEFTLSGDYPVEEVSWYDAVEFANALSELEGLEPCYEIIKADEGDPTVEWPSGLDCEGYRLPTEAEWEYAARGGEPYIYAGSSNLDEVAWYEDNAGQQSHPVGQKKSNGYGLYDMSGNLEEWCWDGYDEFIYQARQDAGVTQDPIGVIVNTDRVVRGGGWGMPPRFERVSNRVVLSAGDVRRIFGFRVVRTAL